MAIIDDLIRDEGLKLTPYKDTEGHLTIGIGINLDAGISEEEARFMCQKRVDLLRLKLSQVFPWFLSDVFGDARRDALLNMAYNLGIGGLFGFHEMLHALSIYRWDDAAKETLESKWAQQVGDRAKRIAGAFKGS